MHAVVVCPSQAGIVAYRNDWTNRTGLRHGGFLPPIPHCVIRKFGYLQKSWYFPLSGTLSQTPDLFRHGKSIALSTTLVVVVVDGRVY